MATNAEKVLHDGIEFSVTKLGNTNLELKKEQYDEIGPFVRRKGMYRTVSPTFFFLAIALLQT